MGEVVSQSKFYVDGGFGNFQLKKCKSCDVSAQKDKEIVTAVGVDDGAGIRRKPGGWELTLEIYLEQGTPEVDWYAVWEAHLPFAFTIQHRGGQRHQYACEVAQCNPKHDDQGSHMLTVKLVATSRKTLPTLTL